MNYKGIVFDFNGTMIFDTEIAERSWRKYIKETLNRDVTDDEFQTYIHGRNVIDTLTYFLNGDVSYEEAKELEEEKEKIYRKLCLEDKEHFRLVSGLEEFLDFLSERNIPINIATASGKRNVDFFFENLGLDKWFDIERIVYNDGTLPGKPAPDIYLKAFENLGVEPGEGVVFEDAPSGIEAAKNAGAGLVVGTSSLLDNEKLENLGADLIINDFLNIERDLETLATTKKAVSSLF